MRRESLFNSSPPYPTDPICNFKIHLHKTHVSHMHKRFIPRRAVSFFAPPRRMRSNPTHDDLSHRGAAEAEGFSTAIDVKPGRFSRRHLTLNSFSIQQRCRWWQKGDILSKWYKNSSVSPSDSTVSAVFQSTNTYGAKRGKNANFPHHCYLLSRGPTCRGAAFLLPLTFCLCEKN